MIKSFIKFFATSVSLPPNEDNNRKKENHSYFGRQVNINSQLVYRSIYIHLPYTQELFTVLNKILVNHEEVENCKFVLKEEEVPILNHNTNSRSLVKQKFRTIDLTEDVPNDFYVVCYPKVLDIALRFSTFIDNEIHRYENLVKTNDEFNSDLVSLI